MRPLPMLAVCVMLLSSCGSKQEAEGSAQLSEGSSPGIPGLTTKAVTDRVLGEMVTSDGWDSARRRTTMTSYSDGLDFNVTIKGPRPQDVDGIMKKIQEGDADARVRLNAQLDTAPIDTVLAELRANPEVGDVVDSQPLLAEIAGVAYDGADPERAVAWLREVWMQPEARSVFGPAEFILLAPSAFERVLIIRKAD
jgi:hypothetical protein